MNSQVLLYDDFGKLLDYRFLRNNEEVEIGKSLEFDSSLVEIYDTIEKEPCSLGINNEQKEIPLTKKGFLHKGVCECPIFPRGWYLMNVLMHISYLMVKHNLDAKFSKEF